MPTVRTDANGGFAFVHIPRTGGIAIAGALLERAGFREVVGRTDSGDYAHHHARASEAGPCARIACVVRHPLERLVSAFITAAALNLHAYAPTREGLDAFCRDAGNSPPTGVFFLPMTHFTQGRVTIVARFEAAGLAFAFPARSLFHERGGPVQPEGERPSA